MNEQTLFEPLSRREREILALLGEGLSDREIAERLFLALPTVKWYNRQSFSKLNVKNRREAVKRAKALGLLAQNGAAEPALAKHNLPSQLTPFVGRSRELAEIDGWLAHPHTRLLTILAPGGMGKTRLALEAAERAISRYTDGVFFAPLASLTSTDHIVPALAEALGLQFTPDGRTPEQQLADFLRRKHLLLVIDNFEHLLEAAPLISDLLTAAPKVTALVTSRERLNLNGEVVYPLAGLHYPEADSEEEPLRFGAVELFIECALRANARFVIEDAAAIGRLCRRVQGMPLAIELAAAWSGALSVDEIDAEIERSADFLQTRMSNVPERQRSVRAVFEAAWARLDADEQRAFRRMPVFRGGCTREAAQAVTGASVRTLAALVDKALLWRDPRTGRYDIHELLRQYAEAELENTGEMEATKQAHQEYYAALTTKWGSAMMLDQVEAGLAVFDADIDNVQRAFARASERAIPAEVEPFTDIWLYYNIRGKLREGLKEFEAACERLEPHDSIAMARLLFLRSDFLNRLRITTNRPSYGKRAVEMMHRLGETYFLPLMMCVWAIECSLVSDIETAADLYQEGYRLARETGHPLMIGALLHQLAWISYGRGDKAEALRQIAEAYQLTKEHQSLWCLCFCTNSLAELSLRVGQTDEAERLFEEDFELASRMQFPAHMIFALQGLALIASMRGDEKKCLHHDEEILKLRLEYSFPDQFILESYLSITDDSLRLDDLENGRYYFQKAHLYIRVNSIEALFEFWLHVAGYFFMKLGEYVQAAAFLVFFERMPATRQLDSMIYEWASAHLAECRAALSPEEFEAAWARGQTMTNEEAIALVAEALR
jgi:predicted ATPase/DNA-binding CsgD family transcriptional regulator